jgi:Flp pilus assembly protein TadG
MATVARRPRRATRDGGEVSLQTVLLTPVLLALVLVVVQAALWLHAVQIADNAAADGADAARRYLATDADGVAAASDFVTGSRSQLAGPPTVQRLGDRVVVDVVVRVPAIVPGWATSVHRSASGPIEQFVPAARR